MAWLTIKELETEMERLRAELHQRVTDGNALSDPSILSLSKQLDTLVTAYLKAKDQQNV